jgi:hypothetical protein
MAKVLLVGLLIFDRLSACVLISEFGRMPCSPLSSVSFPTEEFRLSRYEPYQLQQNQRRGVTLALKTFQAI